MNQKNMEMGWTDYKTSVNVKSIPPTTKKSLDKFFAIFLGIISIVLCKKVNAKTKPYVKQEVCKHIAF